MQISREVFDEQRRPRFGTTNPERMRLAFWEWMIRGDETPPADAGCVLGEFGLMMRAGVLKSGYGPYRARDRFQVPLNRDDGPIWTFDRMGQTRTDLPDGRVVCVGGEHEDSYDPDFCIYNDVVVFGPDGRIEIYGYPKEVFPPTDFHTASLVGDRLIVVGCLGYRDERRPGHTPVYALDLADYRISPVPTAGEAPGWVFEHEADVNSDGVITIRGGKVVEERDGKEQHRRNVEEFALDTRSGVWRRLTNRNWLQFVVRQEDRRWFVLEHSAGREALYPTVTAHTPEPCSEWNQIRFRVEGVPVSVTEGVSEIEIIVEGQLPEDLAVRIAEEVRANAERAIGKRCVLARA
ncbi:hypothetical protein R5W23_005645 [Gemmata sp. JC673]|uniref:Uncharacterized protein n=1 Tax=Gemmata algarum TaxID=2975278 RepID=A0ABU5EVN5_9BACT|nr:hypothetical protein [Gemmata algarum]MDY3558525.1 hypothetical protein [Gemmata algarum]